MPFNRFTKPEGTSHTVLGPEMRSTGEVMGFDADFGTAFAKSQLAYGRCRLEGHVFVSVANVDKRHMIFPIKRLADLGYEILATQGTAEVLRRNGVDTTVVRKHSEGPGGRADHRRAILDGEIDLIVNTPNGPLGAARRLRDPHRGGRRRPRCSPRSPKYSAAVASLDAVGAGSR